MNKKFPVLVSVLLTLGPLSAAAQMTGSRLGGAGKIGMPEVIPAASLTNSGSVSMPLIPAADLHGMLAAPAATVNSAMTPAAAAPAATPASEKPVYAKSLYYGGDEKELVPPASLRYSGSWVDYALSRSPKISFDGAAEKAGADDVMTLSQLDAIRHTVDVQNGAAYDERYDAKNFNLQKWVSSLEAFLKDRGPDYQFKTTIGVDEVIGLLKNDKGINSWLNGDAQYLAARLKEMKEAGLLTAVFARTTKTTDKTEAATDFFEIFTVDGNVLHLHFAKDKYYQSGGDRAQFIWPTKQIDEPSTMPKESEKPTYAKSLYYGGDETE